MKQLRLIAGLSLLIGSQLGVAIGSSHSDLTIASADGTEHYFEVEIANTNRERRRGLMYREQLLGNQGMLFDFKSDARVSMWMVNTLIALDMLFIERDGRIESIVEQTEPLSSSRIRSKKKIRAVLEVNAGTIARLGIKPGDRVLHPIFTKRKRY